MLELLGKGLLTGSCWSDLGWLSRGTGSRRQGWLEQWDRE